MTFETVIVDDALPQEYADQLEKIHTSESFPWYLNEDVTYGKYGKDILGDAYANHIRTPGLNHTTIHFKKTKSSFWKNHVKIAEFVLQKIKYTKKYSVIESRAFMLFPIKTLEEYQSPHTDTDIPHLVILYYVNDVDGDTYFFGKNANDAVSQRITPKKNRAVIFDGSIYHASSLPTRDKRIIINLNLEIENNDL